MKPANQRAAHEALRSARPIVARLDMARHSEEVAADIIDAWNAAETALRAMLGGSALHGQALIHEVRQRQMIGFEQANSLAAFLAARDRVQRTAYHPTAADIEAARAGYASLERAVEEAAREPEPAVAAASARGTAYEPVAESTSGPPLPPARRRGPGVALAAGVLILVIVAAVLAVFFLGGGDSAAYRRGVEHYRAGRPEAARGEFLRAARDDESDARPYIYLGRIARNERDYAQAQQAFTEAIRRDPQNAVAQRDMGILMYLMGRFDLANNFLTRSLERDGTDREALGYMGCVQARRGRQQLAQSFISRAGQGPWTACLTGGAPVTR